MLTAGFVPFWCERDNVASGRAPGLDSDCTPKCVIVVEQQFLVLGELSVAYNHYARMSPPFDHPYKVEAQFLLLASLPNWTEMQKELAGALAKSVTQWDFIIDAAVRKYALPIVHDNIRSMADGMIPPAVVSQIETLSFQFHIDNLRRRALFDWFHRECVSGAGIDYSYFKGPALADRFHERPMSRYFRDIDVLVRPQERVAMIDALLRKGCKVIDFDGEQPFYPNINDKLAFREYIFFTDVPHLLTPGGLMVEVHTGVDRVVSGFDTEDLLHRSIETPSGQHSVRVIPDHDHAVLLCYHHTGHLWSKLNWLADIDAILKSPLIDKQAVRECARRYKLETTVDAAFGMHTLIATGHDPTMPSDNQNALDLLRACVKGLAGDRELEYEMREHNLLATLAFPWQGMPANWWTRTKLFLRRLKPTYADLRTVDGGPLKRYANFVLRKIGRIPRAIRKELSL